MTRWDQCTTKPSPEAPTAIDLFAGAGGLTTGLKNAGFSVVAAVELDPTSASTYRMNHPEVALLNMDIKQLTGPKLNGAARLGRGQVDLLTGCPPCQGFSTLRTRRLGPGQRGADPRNELIFEVLRLTRSMRPRAIVIENVPGLAKDDRFVAFRDALRKIGYQTSYRVLDAQHFGVPQRRRRLVLVGSRVGALPSTLFDASGPPATVRDALTNLGAHRFSGDPLHDIPERRSEAMMKRIRATPKDGGSRRDVPQGIAGCTCHKKDVGYSDVYGRMAWDAVAPTITSGCHNPSKGRFLHPTEDRAITLREAALLQTFPRDYVFDLSRGKEHVARQIGNAFPPKLIQPIAERLRQELLT